MIECAAVLPDAWDTRGSFVCGKPAGHDGPHKSRPSKRRPVVTWQTEGDEQ